VNAFGGDAGHSLRPAASLWRGVSHPGFEKSLRLQPIQGCIKGSYGATTSCCCFDLSPYRGAVSLFAQSNGCSEKQVLELAQHYLHIVIVTALDVNAKFFPRSLRIEPLRIFTEVPDTDSGLLVG
jgi:hypothetical protein